MDRATTKSLLSQLVGRLEKATGADPTLDAEIHAAFRSLGQADLGEAVRDYSGSVKTCFDIIHTLLPHWRWHVGFGVNGIVPYATVSKGQNDWFEASAPTVPLALLLALTRALSASR